MIKTAAELNKMSKTALVAYVIKQQSIREDIKGIKTTIKKLETSNIKMQKQVESMIAITDTLKTLFSRESYKKLSSTISP